ncbi:hypothetical protein DJ494_24915, partial [Klebsiella pneumoniae]
PWLQMTNMISYQGLVRTFLRTVQMMNRHNLAGSLNLASVQHKRDLRVPETFARIAECRS